MKIDKIDELKIYSGFVDKDDMSAYKKLVDRLEPNAIKTGEAINWTPEHLRIYNSKDPDAFAFAIKFAERILQHYQEDLVIHIVGFLKYYVGGSLPVHTDIIDGGTCQECKVGAVVYFNDDYTGGEFIMPKVTDIQFHLPEGSAVSYPADNTKYNHGVNPVTSGVRYALCYCFTTNKDKYPYA
jgi:hypothetical protein